MLFKLVSVFNSGYLLPVIIVFAAAIAPVQSCICKRTRASKAVATSIVNLVAPGVPAEAARFNFAVAMSDKI